MLIEKNGTKKEEWNITLRKIVFSIKLSEPNKADLFKIIWENKKLD